MNPRILIVTVFLVGAAFAGTVWLGNRSDLTPGDKEAEAPVEVDADAPPLDEEAPFPKAVTDETVHEFGTMELGGKGRHTFIIRNEGEDVLVVAKGKSTCKCTLSELTENEIPPGGSVEVDLEWEPKAMQNDFAQAATIWTNDPERPRIDFRIEGNVQQLVALMPLESLNAGAITEGKGATAHGDVFSSILKDFDEPQFEYDSKFMSIELSGLDPSVQAQYEAAFGYGFDVKISPDIPVGAFREPLTVRTVARGEVKEFRVFVEAKRVGPVQFLPFPGTTFFPEATLLDFGRFSASEGRKAQLTLLLRKAVESEDLSNVVIESVECDTPQLQVRHELNEDLDQPSQRAFTLYFEIPADSAPLDRARSTASKITLYTTHPSLPEIVVRAEIHSF